MNKYIALSLCLLASAAPAMASTNDQATNDLFFAITKGDKKLFNAALARGADVNHIDLYLGRNPLFDVLSRVIDAQAALPRTIKDLGIASAVIGPVLAVAAGVITGMNLNDSWDRHLAENIGKTIFAAKLTGGVSVGLTWLFGLIAISKRKTKIKTYSSMLYTLLSHPSIDLAQAIDGQNLSKVVNHVLHARVTDETAEFALPGKPYSVKKSLYEDYILPYFKDLGSYLHYEKHLNTLN
jgi:hypothetical protein